jgi:hypothetical protein
LDFTATVTDGEALKFQLQESPLGISFFQTLKEGDANTSGRNDDPCRNKLIEGKGYKRI